MCMKDYEILSGDNLVAVWKNRELDVVNDSLLPLFLKRFHDADEWLASRAIDSHRANSRLLKKALRMAEKDDVATAVFANGVTITDNYWVREIGSDKKYCDVRFDDDYFARMTSKTAANVALKGNYSSFNYLSTHSIRSSAELTNIGSFEKCWKLIDGKWWMFKSANRNEIFSEVFTYELCKEIEISCAVYEKDSACVKTKDFTDGASVNFEPATAFMGDNEDYDAVINKLQEICPQAISDYIRMIFLDALIANPDRHTANFGLLRNVENGELLGFAPCFDHNMALISRGYPTGTARKDLLITLFADVVNKNPDYRKFIPELNRAIVEKAIEATGMKVRKEIIIEYVMKRYELIIEEIDSDL